MIRYLDNIKVIVLSSMTFLLMAHSNVVMSQENDNCVLPEKVASMSESMIQISSDDESMLIKVLIADDNSERAAGFQKVCPKDAVQPMLFVFEEDIQPSFHMRNVLTPLVIYFLDYEGNAVDKFLMQTYKGDGEKLLYQPRDKVRYALEVPYELAQSQEVLNNITKVKIIQKN